MEKQVFETLIGAVLPPVIDLINKRIEDKKVRYIVSMGVCLLFGWSINMKDLNWANFLASGTLIFASAQTVYQTYWKRSKIRKNLK